MTKIEQIAQVAARLKGLRDALELTTGQIAKDFNITEETYIAYESGDMDIPINFLQKVASRFNVELHALLFNEDPRMKSYFVTRAGRGTKWNAQQPIAISLLPQVSRTDALTLCL